MADYPGDDVRSHRRRFELYRALASTLEAEFADEVVEIPASAPGRQGFKRRLELRLVEFGKFTAKAPGAERRGPPLRKVAKVTFRKSRASERGRSCCQEHL